MLSTFTSEAIRIWRKMSTMEADKMMHFHRNFGVTFLILSIISHIIFVFYGWYSKYDLLMILPPIFIYIYCIIALSLPISAAFQFQHHLRDIKLRSNLGNNKDTLYSNFFVQFQILSTLIRTLPNYPLYLSNPIMDFILGVFIPQIIYRYFRTRYIINKGGARDATCGYFNKKSGTQEELEKVRKMQIRSRDFQSYGFCSIKWIYIISNFFIIYYKGYYNLPNSFLIYLHEICFITSLYQPMFPFLYTLKFKGILHNEYTYWIAWSGVDDVTRVAAVFLGLSFFVKNFIFGDIFQFPFVFFIIYAICVISGIWFNIKHGKYQDYLLWAIFGTILAVQALGF